MSVLIKDMEKPKSCFEIIDGDFEYCPFVNTDDDCVLLLKKGICNVTWGEQYGKCPLVEVLEPCEDALKKIKNASFVGSDGLDYVETLQALDALKDAIGVTLHVTKISKHCSDFSDLDEVIECEDAVSRRKAFEYFVSLWECIGTIMDREEWEDVCKTTANELPSVTPKPEPCEDAVSRAELLSAFPVDDEPTVTKSSLRMTIKHLPSVTPMHKTWKWIEYDSDDDKYDVIKCPCCKHTFTVDAYHWTDIGFVKDDFKFCPNCGADMNPLPEPYKPKEKNDACD